MPDQQGSGPVWAAGVTSHHSSDQTQHCLTAWLLDSWWFVSVVHTIFSQPARTWHYQLLEGRLSFVLGIHCQPANTFSEWLKRGAVKSSNISEAVNLDYTFWFSRCLCWFYATWTLAEWHTTGVQHFFLAKGIWPHNVASYTSSKSAFCCPMSVPQLSPCRCFTSFNLMLAPASVISIPHHQIAWVRVAISTLSHSPADFMQLHQTWNTSQGLLTSPEYHAYHNGRLLPPGQHSL